MSWQDDEETLIRRYLLNFLDEKQQEQVEERLLCDDDFADRLYAAQDNLIDDYAFNLLPEEERESFEKNFTLTDERRRKLLFAQTLESYVKIDEPRPLNHARSLSHWWKDVLLFLKDHKAWSVTAFATLLLLVLLGPKILSWLRPLAPPALSQDRARIERQIAELNKRPFDANQASHTLELTLQPALLREGGEIKKAVLTSAVTSLSLKLVLTQVRYASYRALVRTVEGRELFAIEDLKPEAGAAEILLKIPSEFLPKGDYQVELKGIAASGYAEDAARYNFQVRR